MIKQKMQTLKVVISWFCGCNQIMIESTTIISPITDRITIMYIDVILLVLSKTSNTMMQATKNVKTILFWCKLISNLSVA